MSFNIVIYCALVVVKRRRLFMQFPRCAQDPALTVVRYACKQACCLRYDFLLYPEFLYVVQSGNSRLEAMTILRSNEGFVSYLVCTQVSQENVTGKKKGVEISLLKTSKEKRKEEQLQKVRASYGEPWFRRSVTAPLIILPRGSQACSTHSIQTRSRICGRICY